jgi:hypothetical protein
MAEEVPPQGAWHDFKSLHFKLFYYKYVALVSGGAF